MDLDVAQVRAFVAAADHATLTRAAAELYLSQQALSKRLARLEATVGTLFDRRPTGLELTARGRRFLPVARELLATADLALATARDDPPAPLRVDVWGHLHPIHALVQAFTADHPEAVVELSMRRNLPQALTALARREIDVATGNLANLGEPLQAGLAAELITGTRLAALVNERNELAVHDAVRAQDLRRRRHRHAHRRRLAHPRGRRRPRHSGESRALLPLVPDLGAQGRAPARPGAVREPAASGMGPAAG